MAAGDDLSTGNRADDLKGCRHVLVSHPSMMPVAQSRSVSSTESSWRVKK
jgi:hypothetical protein